MIPTSLADLLKLPYLVTGLLIIRLHNLQLKGFRNYRHFRLDFIKERLLIIGSNGLGKSNLLEAVELLGSLRSHRCSRDQDLIHWEESRAVISAIVDESDKLVLELRRQGGRQAHLNARHLTRQFDLLG